MQMSPIGTAWDQERREHFAVSRCHNCDQIIDHRKGHYQDNLGRWEFCVHCYVHAPHPAGQTVAWWYATERSKEIANAVS